METKSEILEMGKSELRGNILTWHFRHLINISTRTYPENRNNVNCPTCIHCIECTDCIDSTNCLESKNLDACIDCNWCENCIGCVDCEFLVNGIYCMELKLSERNPDEYYIRDMKFTKEEFFRKKAELFN